MNAGPSNPGLHSVQQEQWRCRNTYGETPSACKMFRSSHDCITLLGVITSWISGSPSLMNDSKDSQFWLLWALRHLTWALMTSGQAVPHQQCSGPRTQQRDMTMRSALASHPMVWSNWATDKHLHSWPDGVYLWFWAARQRGLPCTETSCTGRSSWLDQHSLFLFSRRTLRRIKRGLWVPAPASEWADVRSLRNSL